MRDAMHDSQSIIDITAEDDLDILSHQKNFKDKKSKGNSKITENLSIKS